MANKYSPKVANKPSYSSLGEQVLAHAQPARYHPRFCAARQNRSSGNSAKQYLRGKRQQSIYIRRNTMPYVINNDGTLSRNAAEVFFTSLVEAEKAGKLEAGNFCPGTRHRRRALFARFFLDRFKELCVKNKQDFYDRLCYVAADRSERMLQDVLRHGVLGNHRRALLHPPGRCHEAGGDACEPCALSQRQGQAVSGGVFELLARLLAGVGPGIRVAGCFA